MPGIPTIKPLDNDCSPGVSFSIRRLTSGDLMVKICTDKEGGISYSPSQVYGSWISAPSSQIYMRQNRRNCEDKTHCDTTCVLIIRFNVFIILGACNGGENQGEGDKCGEGPTPGHFTVSSGKTEER